MEASHWRAGSGVRRLRNLALGQGAAATLLESPASHWKEGDKAMYFHKRRAKMMKRI